MKKTSSHNKRVNKNLDPNTSDNEFVASMVYYDKYDFYDIQWHVLKECCEWYLHEDDSKQSKEKRLMLAGLSDILIHCDNNPEVAEFLDKIDSRLIYHLNPEDWSKREIVCAYMNTICDWSDLTRTDSNVYNDEKIYSVKELYAGLKDYTYNVLKRSRRTLMPYKDFIEHLKKHAYVKYSKQMYNTVRLNGVSVCGLPQRKNYANK